MTKKKLLVLASTFPTFIKGDSTPPFVFELSKKLTERFEVHILAPHSKGAAAHQKTNGLTIHRFKYWFGKSKLADGAILPNLKKNRLFYFQVPFFLLLQFLAIKKLQKKYGFDTIHAHWLIPQGLLAVLYKNIHHWNGNIICTIHGGDIFGLQFLNRLKRWVIRKSTSITVVSEAIKQEVDKLNIDKTAIKVIPMGVDTSKFNPDKKDIAIRKKYNIKGPFLLYVGRLSEKKGVEYLLKAMPKIIDHFTDVKLVIAGHGELEHQLKELVIEKLRIADHVVFAGGIPNSDLPKYYASADIFIGPSVIAKDGDREGFPVSFMEAMACNTPLIISDLDVFKLFENKKNALKAKEKSLEEIADCVVQLIENSDLQQVIIRNNVQLIHNTFSLEAVGNKYINVLLN